MGIFGPSRKEKFVRSDARSLATYLKNNAVKLGGEAYAKCQTIGVLPKEIDRSLLWYFWSIVYSFRVAHETLTLKSLLDDQTLRTLFDAFVQIDNQYFRVVEHAPYEETFGSVNVALELIKANGKMPTYEQASLFMLYAVKSIRDLTDRDQRFTVVQMLTEAATSFPGLGAIIDQNA